jgi:hypothetical protein
MDMLQVSENERPSTKWSDAQLGFILYIPKALVYQPAQYLGLFKEQLLECFEENQPSKSLPIHSTTGDEWADVGAEEPEEEPSKPPQTSAKAPAVDYLPDPNTMPKPGALFQQAPYHLFVYTSTYNRSYKIEIECSHSQTLEVLAEYLKKWTKTNVNRVDRVSIPFVHGILESTHLTHPSLLRWRSHSTTPPLASDSSVINSRCIARIDMGLSITSLQL